MEDKPNEAAADQQEALLRTFFTERFGATLASVSQYLAQSDRFFTPDGQQLVPSELVDFVYRTPIEELGFHNSAYDAGTKKNSLRFDSAGTAPLLLEVKQFRNLSRPYQRIGKAEPGEKIQVTGTGAKRDHTFSLVAHDGVRFIKLVLLMPNQASIVGQLHERNKLLLKSGYVDTAQERGAVIILVDAMDQVAVVHNDKQGSTRLWEQQMEVQGLPIKATNAPKFVFLNEHAKEGGAKPEEEREDEYADLYKAMDVHDLTGKELIYMKRFEQMGFWRKKFTNEES